MSSHSQRTHRGPSVPSIVVTSAAALVATIASFWVMTGPVIDERHLTGGALGLVLAVLLAAQAIVRVAEWQEAAERSRERRGQARRARVRNTGTWLGDSPGQSLTVRWDEMGRRYLIQGWISDHIRSDEEREWATSLDDLAGLLAEIERSGQLRPVADEGTRMVRSRLAVTGWDGAPEPDPVATQPTGTEPAHLHRAAMPVRRFEHDGPTRNLTDRVRDLSGPASRVRNTWGDRP